MIQYKCKKSFGGIDYEKENYKHYNGNSHVFAFALFV